MSWVDPIFDRTADDVRFANQNRHSPLPLKGARNYTDLIRITGNIHFIWEQLSISGHALPRLESKTEWYLGEVIPQEEIDKIRRDLDIIKSAFPPSSLSMIFPPTPNLPYNSYQKINDIERIAFESDRLLKLAKQSFRKSGTFKSGQKYNFRQRGSV